MTQWMETWAEEFGVLGMRKWMPATFLQDVCSKVLRRLHAIHCKAEHAENEEDGEEDEYDMTEQWLYDLEERWDLRQHAEQDTDDVEEDTDMEETETFPDRLLAVYKAAGSSSEALLESQMDCLSEWTQVPKKKTGPSPKRQKVAFNPVTGSPGSGKSAHVGV